MLSPNDIPAEIDRVVAAIRSPNRNAIRKASRGAVKVALQVESVNSVRRLADAIAILIAEITERYTSTVNTNLGRIHFDCSTERWAKNEEPDHVDGIVSAIHSRNRDAIRKASRGTVKFRLESACRKLGLSEEDLEGIGFLVAHVFERYYLRERIPVGMEDDLTKLEAFAKINSWDRLWRSRPRSVMRRKPTRKKPTRNKPATRPVAATGACELIESCSWLWTEIRKRQSQATSDASSTCIPFPEPCEPLTAPIRYGKRHLLPDPLPSPYKAPPLQAKQVTVKRPFRPKTRSG